MKLQLQNSLLQCLNCEKKKWQNAGSEAPMNAEGVRIEGAEGEENGEGVSPLSTRGCGGAL